MAAASRIFQDRGVRWYLFGAQAVIVWGRPRMSADVDVTVDMDPEQAPDLLAKMKEHGFAARKREGLQAFVRRTRVLPLLHEPTDFPLDVVFAGPGLEQGFLDRARRVELAGDSVPVISPEDLLVGKILAGRSKDLEDVRGVLEQRGEELDIDHVRELLSLLEQMLSRGDLVSVLEREIRRVDSSAG